MTDSADQSSGPTIELEEYMVYEVTTRREVQSYEEALGEVRDNLAAIRRMSQQELNENVPDPSGLFESVRELERTYAAMSTRIAIITRFIESGFRGDTRQLLEARGLLDEAISQWKATMEKYEKALGSNDRPRRSSEYLEDEDLADTDEKVHLDDGDYYEEGDEEPRSGLYTDDYSFDSDSDSDSDPYGDGYQID